MRMRKVFVDSTLAMFGDCQVWFCGHSFIYHIPLVGCTRCSCDEFH